MQKNNGWLYFIVGGLVVAVGVFAFIFFQDQQTDQVDMKLELPGGNKVGVEGTVEK